MNPRITEYPSQENTTFQKTLKANEQKADSFVKIQQLQNKSDPMNETLQIQNGFADNKILLPEIKTEIDEFSEFNNESDAQSYNTNPQPKPQKLEDQSELIL